MEIIERLMDRECPYGEPEFSQLGKEVSAISTTLSAQLDEGGQKLLDGLRDLEMQRIVLAQEDAFEEGFCSGVKLMWAVKDHK